MPAIKWLVWMIVLTSLAAAQQWPDAPRLQLASSRQARSNREVLRSKKFYLPAVALLGATVYDVEVTHQGLAHYKCQETTGSDPRPSRGKLYRNNALIDGAMIGLGFVFEQWRIPWVSAGMSSLGTAVHIYGGTRWFTEGCF